MIIRLNLADTTLHQIQERASLQAKSQDALIGQLLYAALKLPEGHTVILDSPTLDTLEHILGGGSILNQEDLTRKVQNLAGITYGNIRLDFTPGQLREIGERAARLSMTAEELIRRTTKKMEELFFTHLGLGA